MNSEYIEPKVLTVLATYRCTAACKNCCFDSNPYVQGRLSKDQLEEVIAFAANLGSVEMVVFSGGECFLLNDDLVHSVARCTEHGMQTRCVTNAYWAKSKEAGRRRLADLVQAGLTELNISTGDFHREFVDLDAVLNAAELGVEFGVRTLVVVEARKHRTSDAAELMREERVCALFHHAQPRAFTIIEGPWMPMSDGEAIEYGDGCSVNAMNVHLRGGCDSIFRALVVNPSMRVGICCGLTREKIHELTIANGLDTVSASLKAAGSDFVKIWLAVDGPEKIVAWAAMNNKNIQWENRFAHKCHACKMVFHDAVVRSTIVKHYKERVPDVLMRYSILRQQQDILDSLSEKGLSCGNRL